MLGRRAARGTCEEEAKYGREANESHDGGDERGGEQQDARVALDRAHVVPRLVHRLDDPVQPLGHNLRERVVGRVTVIVVNLLTREGLDRTKVVHQGWTASF